MVAADVLIAPSVYHYKWGMWYKAGVFHPLYLICFFAWMLATLGLLFWKIRRERRVYEKNKLRFILACYAISYLAAVDYLPTYGFNLYPAGFLPVSIYLVLIGFASAYYNVLGPDLRWDSSYFGTRHTVA